MTYQEYYEKVKKEFEEASSAFFKTTTTLSEINGFGDFDLIDDYQIARKDLEITSNNYWGFLSYIRDKDINPNDEFII